MLAMAIKAIAMSGMGPFFNDDKEVYKLATAYEEVRSFSLYVHLQNCIVFIKQFLFASY